MKSVGLVNLRLKPGKASGLSMKSRRQKRFSPRQTKRGSLPALLGKFLNIAFQEICIKVYITCSPGLFLYASVVVGCWYYSALKDWPWVCPHAFWASGTSHETRYVWDMYVGTHECEGNELHLNVHILFTLAKVFLGHIVFHVSFPASNPLSPFGHKLTLSTLVKDEGKIVPLRN
jgi:mRNA-degrading endonuclease HigB of HigAB toxin-antitoxin module